MVPQCHHRLSPQAVRKDVRHSHGKRRCAPRTIEKRLLADDMGQRLHLHRSDRKSPTADGRSRGLWRRPHNPGGTVNREIRSRLQHTRRNHRHDRDHGFSDHCPVADHSGLNLPGNQFGCGAARDQRVEAADRATGNGDEGERKNLARENRARAVDKPG